MLRLIFILNVNIEKQTLESNTKSTLVASLEDGIYYLNHVVM